MKLRTLALAAAMLSHADSAGAANSVDILWRINATPTVGFETVSVSSNPHC
jgi:hypothetical protein